MRPKFTLELLVNFKAGRRELLVQRRNGMNGETQGWKTEDAESYDFRKILGTYDLTDKRIEYWFFLSV